MPQNHQHKSEWRSSSDEAALRIKRECVLARLDRYTSTLITGPVSRARLTHLLLDSSSPAQQLPLLALASTIFDGIDEDPDRRLGQQVRGGAKKRGAETKRGAAERHQTWQKQAEEIWARRPDLSISAVARIIAHRSDNTPNTIRLHIKSPHQKADHDSLTIKRSVASLLKDVLQRIVRRLGSLMSPMTNGRKQIRVDFGGSNGETR